MASSSRIFSGVIWSVIMNIVNALYGFFLIPILISYFGKAEYGLIGLAQSINAYMQLMDMGLTSTNVRYFSNWLAKHDNDKVNRLFQSCTFFYGCVGLLNALILLVVFFFSDRIFNVTYEQNQILQNLLLILVFSAFVNWVTSCYNQIIQASENVAWVQKRLLYTKLLMIVVLAATVLLKLNIVIYFLLTVCCNWVILPWAVKKIKSIVPFISFFPKFDKEIIKEILPYTLSIFSFSIFQFSYSNLRPVFLGIQSSVESVADYRIVTGVVGICSAVSGVFLNALLPSSSKAIANNDLNAYNRIAYDGTKYIMCFLGFCVFGMVCISNELLKIYVGDEFLYLVPSLNILLLALLSRHMNAIASLILGGTNIKIITWMTAVSATVSLLVAWFLIADYQMMGIAVSAVVFELMQAVFYYTYYFPKIMSINSKKIFITIFLPVFCFGIMSWIFINLLPRFETAWGSIALKGVAFVTLYMLFMLCYLNKNDKQFIMKLTKIKR